MSKDPSRWIGTTDSECIPDLIDQIETLEAEVERLREHLAQEVRVFDIRIDERNTTIATLEEKLEKCKCQQTQ